MRVTYHKQFEKDIDLYATPEKIREIFDFVDLLEQARSLHELQNIKKLSGFREFYRVRFGEYRLGLRKKDTGEIQLDRFLHRKDIYKKYP